MFPLVALERVGEAVNDGMLTDFGDNKLMYRGGVPTTEQDDDDDYQPKKNTIPPAIIAFLTSNLP